MRGWLDGHLLEAPAPPAHDGPGLFETLRCEAGELFWLAEHLARLEHGARKLALAWPPPWDPRAALLEVAHGLALAVVRLEWTPPHLSVAVRAPARLAAPLTALLLAPGAVEPPRPAGVKSTRRAGYAAARERARERGAFDALVRTSAGELVEGTIANLFVAAGGALATPPLSSGALPGVVRAAVLSELAARPLVDAAGRSWRALERPLTAADLARAEEVLLTNAVVGVAALERILDDEGGGALLPGARGALSQALTERVRRIERASLRTGFQGPDPC